MSDGAAEVRPGGLLDRALAVASTMIAVFAAAFAIAAGARAGWQLGKLEDDR